MCALSQHRNLLAEGLRSLLGGNWPPNVLLVNKPQLIYHRPPLKCVKIQCISWTIQLDRTCGRVDCSTPEISYRLVRTAAMLSWLYSLLCFFVSHVHFLIFISTCSEHHGLLEVSVNALAKNHEPKDVRRGGSPVLYSDQSFDRFSLWPKPALPTQQTKSEIVGSEQGQMLSESCHYTTESHHLRRPLDCGAGMLLQSTWYSGLSAFQQLQPKHEVLWQHHQKFSFLFFFFHRQHNRNEIKYWQSSRITSIKFKKLIHKFFMWHLGTHICDKISRVWPYGHQHHYPMFLHFCLRTFSLHIPDLWCSPFTMLLPFSQMRITSLLYKLETLPALSTLSEQLQCRID